MTDMNMPEQDTARKNRRVAGRLKLLLAAWRFNAALRGIFSAAAAFWLPVAVGIFSGAEGAARAWILCGSGFACAAIFLVNVLWSLARPLGLIDAAFLAERSAPELLKGIAAATIELNEGRVEKGGGYNPAMLAALADQAAGAMPALNIPRAVNARLTAKIIAIPVVLIIASVAVLHFANTRPGDVAAFLSPPYIPRPETFQLISVTGDVTVPLGGDVKIEVVARGNIKARPALELEREGLEPFEKKLEETAREEGARKYSAEIASVAGDMTYRVSAKNFRSDAYHIFTVDPPAIRKMAVTLVYPEYTGLLPDRREGGGDLRAPYGTKAEFTVESSAGLSRAFIKLEDGREIALGVEDGRVAKGRLTVEADSRYTVNLVDGNGFANRFPPEYVIESVADAAPEITLIFPDDDVTVSRVSELKVRGGAKDDYIVNAVRLHWKIAGTEKKDVEKIAIQPAGEALFEYTWDLGGIEAYEGDVLEYFLGATDNDTLTGPKTAYSVTRRVHLLSRFEDYEESREDQEEVIARMESVMREGEMLSEKFRDLARTLDTSPKSAQKWRAEAGRALDRQEQMEKELSEISESMRESISRMQNNELVDLDSLSKMQEIDSLMRDIMTDEIRSLIDKVRKNVEKVDLSNVDRQLVENMKNQDRIMESLDRTLDRLRKIRLEQEMEALRRHLEDLVKRQDDLLERTEDLAESAKDGKLNGPQAQEAVRQSREQSKIRNGAEAAMNSMEKLSGEIKDLSPQSSGEIGRLAELGRKKDLAGDMSRAEECLRKGSMGQCAGSEKKALSTLREMSTGMAALQAKYTGEMDEETKRLIKELLVRTIDISGAHEAALVISERIVEQQGTGIPGERMRELISEEKIAREAAEFLREDVSRLVVLTMGVSPRIAGLAQEAVDNLEQAISFLAQDQAPNALGAQRGAAKKFNQLALALLEAKKNAGKQSQGSALSDFMDELQRLAGSQESLNAATARMGASGMPIPGMGDALQTLALQQKMIGEGLGQLSQEMAQMGEMGERLGQIQDEMEKIQKALAEGNAGEEVQRRQSKVLRRLKDTSLSLRKEVLEENRVAESAKDYEAESPGAVRDLLREALPPEIIQELERYRKEPRAEGYERLIEKYYNELMRGDTVNKQ